LAALAAAMLLAIGGAVVVALEPAQAAFPGLNGKIAFVSAPSADSDISVMNPDGSGGTNLTNNPARDSAPAFSPDGSRVAFTSNRDGNREIYVMDSSGSNPMRLTNDWGHDFHPAFSSNGKRIVFVSNRDGNQEIYVMDSSGSNPTALTSTSSANEDDPAFSPDGSKIAFTSDAKGNKDIYVMASDGSDPPIRLTDDPADDYQPNWSPDGSMITFASKRDVPILDSEIYVMKADGSEQKGLTNASDGYSDYEPCFSPDGSKIAFTHDFTCVELPCPPGELCICPAEEVRGFAVMNADGTDLNLGPGDAGNPDWQPNTAPVVTLLRPAPGSTTTDRTPRISAKVTDTQDNLAKANITLSLDEQVIKRTNFVYDRSADRLSYKPGIALPYGWHMVRVVAVDTSEVKTMKEWRFRVVRP
jgi:Tol biopolymer transport system component